MESTARRPVADVRGGILSEMVRCCSVIYQKAADAYRILASNAMSEEISQLWGEMADGMNKHIMYWKKVAEHVEKNRNIEILGNPYEVVEQLRNVESRIDTIRKSCSAFRSVLDYFYLAYSIEVELIHPTLFSLPESVISVPAKEVVKWNYYTNLKKFLSGMNRHCEPHYLHTALMDSLERMWVQNRRLAEQDSLDPVTGAYKRRFLWKIISAYSKLAERDGHNVAIILIGMDNMHDLYTTFDLKTGDEVVHRFYSGIKPGIRVSDISGRYDFSTFLIYLSKVNHQYLYEIGGRFAESAHSIQKAGFGMSVYIGGSYGPIRTQGARQIEYYLRKAWDCLMRAKLSRTQRIVIE